MKHITFNRFFAQQETITLIKTAAVLGILTWGDPSIINATAQFIVALSEYLK